MLPATLTFSGHSCPWLPSIMLTNLPRPVPVWILPSWMWWQERHRIWDETKALFSDIMISLSSVEVSYAGHHTWPLSWLYFIRGLQLTCSHLPQPVFSLPLSFQTAEEYELGRASVKKLYSSSLSVHILALHGMKFDTICILPILSIFLPDILDHLLYTDNSVLTPILSIFHLNNLPARSLVKILNKIHTKTNSHTTNNPPCALPSSTWSPLAHSLFFK